MATESSFFGCACHNPALTHLAECVLTDETIKKISELAERRKETNLPPQQHPASVIYTGGIIRPLINGSMDTVEAIGFHGGRVVAVGSQSVVVDAMKSHEYRQIKLPGQTTLLPGLIEPHVHIVLTALVMSWNDFGPFDGQDLREPYDTKWLKDIVEKCKPPNSDHWILGYGVDPSLMPPLTDQGGKKELQTFSCKVLDECIESKRPLAMVSASMHTVYVNTPAAEKIYCHSQEVQKMFKTSAEFCQHVNANGGLQESTEMLYAIHAIPLVQLLKTGYDVIENLHSLFNTASQRGVTLMYDAWMLPKHLAALEAYLFFTKRRVRIGYAKYCSSLDDAEKMTACESLNESNTYQGGAKLVSDGSNQGLTGYQNEDFCCNAPHARGVFNFPPNSTNAHVPDENFTKIVRPIVQKKCPLLVHANGDQAIDIVIAAYKDALGGESGLERRHRIEHCSLLNEAKLDAMKEMGLSPSFLIGHVGYWGYAFRNVIFNEKAEEMLDLCKSALDRGIRITLHSDNAVSPLGPLRMMEQAITRIMEGDPNKAVLNEKEKITAEQALRAVTFDAAWQCHADELVGSLSPNNFADYVILQEDPVARGKNNPVGMRNIKVLETWLGGMQVYAQQD